jgi:hypothetical protein
MSPEIMWPKPNPNPVACLLDHCPGSFIGYGEDPLMGLNPFVPDVFLESVSHLLRDKYVLSFFPAFGVPECQFSVVHVHRSYFQNLAHSHTASGHQLQHETVPQFRRCEDDFVDHIFSDDLPGDDGPGPEHLSQHRAVAGATKICIDIGSDKIEEGCEVGILDALGLLFLPFGDLVQEFEDLISGDAFNAPFAKILVKSVKERLVGLNPTTTVTGDAGFYILSCRT